jgi:hypothetical protein
MAKIKKKRLAPEECWVEDPEWDPAPSAHGAQAEDNIIRNYLAPFGWAREFSDEMKQAFFPPFLGSPIRLGNEGNGRGRGVAWIDAARANHMRACGGDAFSMKVKTMREEGSWATDVLLCNGSVRQNTVEGGIAALRALYHRGGGAHKALPLVVVRQDRSGMPVSFGIDPATGRIPDLPSMFARAPASSMDKGWDGESRFGLPLKPKELGNVGRRGFPVNLWIEHNPKQLTRTQGDRRYFCETWMVKSSTKGLVWAPFFDEDGTPEPFVSAVNRATSIPNG